MPLTVELEIVARPVLCNPPPNPTAIGTPGSWSVPLSCKMLRAMTRTPSLKIPPPSPAESMTTFSEISVWSMIAVPELLSPPPRLDTPDAIVPSAKFSFSELRLSPHGISFLTDGIILQRYTELDGALQKVMSVVKLRARKHAKELYAYEITDKGIEVGEALTRYSGILTGNTIRRKSAKKRRR